MNPEYSHFKPFTPNLLVASLNVCAPNWGEINCCYAYHKFYYFQDGEATLTIQENTFHPQKGDLFLIPAGVQHSYCHNPDYPVYKYWCHFSITPSDVWNFHYHATTIFCHPDSNVVIPIFEQLIQVYQTPSLLSSIQQIYLLTKLCYEFFKEVDFSLMLRKTTSSFYTDISEYIQAHIAEKITLQELSNITHLQKNYFISRFKKEFGTTPIDYINHHRLDRVARYLSTDPVVSINEAALANGYEDYRYFTRLFKQRYGITPSDYRKSLQTFSGPSS